MYSIYADDKCFYEDTNDLKELKVSSPKLTLSENSAGSLEVTVPVTNICYSYIDQMKSDIIVKKNGEEIWSGRVLSEKTNWLNSRVLYCEGELAYLNDSIQPQVEYTNGVTIDEFVDKILNIHNQNVASNRTFTKGIVTVTPPEGMDFYSYTNYESTMDIINWLVDSYGGHLRIRKKDGKRYLDYLKDYPNINSQTIQFGRNLVDISKNLDMSTFCTAIIPLGAMLEDEAFEGMNKYLTVESVNEGSPYVYSKETVEKYGWITRTVNFDDITDPTELKQLGELYLQTTQFASMELEISAVDLHMANPNVEDIKLLDIVHVISEPHGMDVYFPTTSIAIQLDAPGNTKYTFNTSSNVSISSNTSSSVDAIYKHMDDLPNKFDILKAAKEDASGMITTAINGNITTKRDPITGRPTELIICDDPDYKKAKRVWRWNINGLGFSETGYDGEYKLAATMDGSIVADMITSGTLNASLIRAGIIKSINGDSSWNLETGVISAGLGGKVIIGHYAFIPRSNGNTSVKFIG